MYIFHNLLKMTSPAIVVHFTIVVPVAIAGDVNRTY